MGIIPYWAIDRQNIHAVIVAEECEHFFVLSEPVRITIVLCPVARYEDWKAAGMEAYACL